MVATHSSRRLSDDLRIAISRKQVESDVDVAAREFSRLTGINIDPSNIRVVLRGAEPINFDRLKNRIPLILNTETYMEDLRTMSRAPEKNKGALAFQMLVRYSTSNIGAGIVRAAEMAQNPNKYSRISAEMSDFFSKRAANDAERQRQASMGRFLGTTYLGSLSKLFAAHMISDGVPIVGPFSRTDIMDSAVSPIPNSEISTA